MCLGLHDYLSMEFLNFQGFLNISENEIADGAFYELSDVHLS